MKIFDYKSVYTAHADNKTFFLEGISFLKVLLKDMNLFSSISGLHPKFTKCEIAGIVVLKSVNVTLCGMKYLDLTKKCINVLGEHISKS